MLLASVRPMPSSTSTPAVPLRQQIAASAIATITLLRSKRSPIARPISAASAITLEYIRLVVIVMPCLISSVGTQFAKP